MFANTYLPTSFLFLKGNGHRTKLFLSHVKALYLKVSRCLLFVWGKKRFRYRKKDKEHRPENVNTRMEWNDGLLSALLSLLILLLFGTSNQSQ